MTASQYRFAAAKDTAVVTCERVKGGHPVLFVSHEANGKWQFLCGGDHARGGGDEALLVHLAHVVEGDPSLNELAEMCSLRSATRVNRGAPWVIHDEMEDIIRANVREHGWHAMKVGGDAEGPGFIYTIGLYRSFGHPEMICVGLPLDVAHGALWDCARHVKSGGKLGDGAEFWDAFEGARCAFREVRRKHYRDYLGYARWFYDGDDFPVVQMLWPDSKGRLPLDEGCAESTVRAQTPLWTQ